MASRRWKIAGVVSVLLTWVGLANSSAQQKVELELLLADDVRALVQQRLGR